MTPEEHAAPPVLARGLLKRYGDVVAVGGIDLTLERGTCLGLLGPNGAGKTTTIEILEGLLEPDEGAVRILGMEWEHAGAEIRRRIGVQLQETHLPDKLTVWETLRVFRSLFDEGRDPEEVLRLIGLEEKRRSRLEKLSGGQRQRVALGCALVNEPDILFLDEPTTGLDPQARRQVWEVVERFQGRGGTVLLTTHYMDEAERLADHVVILDHGRILAEGTPREIVGSLGAESVIELSIEGTDGDGLPARVQEVLGAVPGVVSLVQRTRRTSLTVRELHVTLPALLEQVRLHGWSLADLETHRPTLDDVFVSLTGRHLRDG